MVLSAIFALDWSVYEGDSIPANTKFEVLKAHVIGYVAHEDAEKVVLAQQVFADGTLRAVVVIPKVCILQRADLTNPIPPATVGTLEPVKPS